jgi:nitrate/nitrite transporter NarK
VLYIGTFGSFIGFGFAFGQVLQVQFTADFDTPIKAAYLTFLGPLLGSLIRPVGGWAADRLGGAKVTFWNFVAMAIGASIVLTASVERSLPLFIAGFVLLFVFSGIGNGSTYKMIPRDLPRQDAHGGRGASAVRRPDRRRRRDRGVRRRPGEPGLPPVVSNVQDRQRRLYRLHRLLRPLLRRDLGGVPPLAEAAGRLSGCRPRPGAAPRSPASERRR